jgi:hypothetical protein
MRAQDCKASSIQMEHRAAHPSFVSDGAANNNAKFRTAQSTLLFFKRNIA